MVANWGLLGIGLSVKYVTIHSARLVVPVMYANGRTVSKAGGFLIMLPSAQAKVHKESIGI